MSDNTKVMTGGSDASAGFGVAPDKQKARIRIPRKGNAVAMLEAAMRGVTTALMSIEDETITPNAVPAPVPPQVPADVADKGIRATVGEVIEPDAYINDEGVASEASVVNVSANSPEVTVGKVPATVIQEPDKLQHLTQMWTYPDVQTEQDDEAKDQPANANPPDHPVAGEGTYSTKNTEDDYLGQALEPSNVPSTVPDYRVSINPAKACATCKFYTSFNPASTTGQCAAYDFVAKSTYVCDSWQQAAQKAAPIIQQSKPASEHRGGEAIGNNFGVQTGKQAGFPDTLEFSYQKKPELSRSHGREKALPIFMPNDRVYSKSIRRLGDVVKSEYLDNTYIYTIKLIDRYGGSEGIAVAQESDLVPRSMRAIKRIESHSVRANIEEQIKGLVDQLKTICTMHGDLKSVPIPIARLQTVEATCKEILESPSVNSVSKDTSFRKYIRAVQDIQHGMAAASHLIVGAKEIADVEPAKAIDAMAYAQKNAYARCKDALERAEGSLMDEVPMRTVRQRIFRDIQRDM